MTQPSYVVPQRRIGTADRVVTVMLLIVLAPLVAIASFMGMLTSMASDGCMGSTCSSGLIGLGVITSASSPVVFGLAALVWVIIRWTRDRPTWWVPLAGALAGALGWGLGAMITTAGVS